MTIQEAITMLKSKMDGSVDTSYEWADCVRLAIAALERTEKKFPCVCLTCACFKPADSEEVLGHCVLSDKEYAIKTEEQITACCLYEPRDQGKAEPAVAPDPDALIFTASTDGIKSAAEQRANQEIWRHEREVAGWRATVAELTDAINNLWRSGGSYVLFWEEQWFPGYEDFLEKIQKLGYHVYLQTENRDDTPLSRFIITLDYTGGREKWEEWKRPTETSGGAENV